MDQIFIEIKILDNPNKLKAFADVTFTTSIGELCVKSFRIVDPEDGKALWVGFPQTSFQKNGKTQYIQLLELGKKARHQLQDKILEEYAKCSKN